MCLLGRSHTFLLLFFARRWFCLLVAFVCFSLSGVLKSFVLRKVLCSPRAILAQYVVTLSSSWTPTVTLWTMASSIRFSSQLDSKDKVSKLAVQRLPKVLQEALESAELLNPSVLRSYSRSSLQQLGISVSEAQLVGSGHTHKSSQHASVLI